MFNGLVILGNPETAPMVRAAVAATGLVTVMRELPSFPGRYELARLLSALSPDLVVIDMSAGADAFECAARIRELSPGTPLVGVGCSRETRLLATQAGPEVSVSTECTPEELAIAIRRALERHQSGRDRRLFAFLPAKAGSGCSAIVLNTAIAAASWGRRVLVLDADLRSSVLGVMLGADVVGGIQAVLASSPELDLFCLRRNLVQRHGVDFTAVGALAGLTPA